MRKLYLVLETTKLAVPPVPHPRAPRAPEEQAIRPRAADRQRQPEPDDERFEIHQNVDIIVCYSMPEAEEYIDQQLERQPQYKFIIFESIAFLETVASPTIRKLWDANGQLVETR